MIFQTLSSMLQPLQYPVVYLTILLIVIHGRKKLSFVFIHYTVSFSKAIFSIFMLIVNLHILYKNCAEIERNMKIHQNKKKVDVVYK